MPEARPKGDTTWGSLLNMTCIHARKTHEIPVELGTLVKIFNLLAFDSRFFVSHSQFPCFEAQARPNAVTSGAVLSALAAGAQWQRALQMLQTMPEVGV